MSESSILDGTISDLNKVCEDLLFLHKFLDMAHSLDEVEIKRLSKILDDIRTQIYEDIEYIDKAKYC